MNESGNVLLPWLRPVLREALRHQRGHALLVHGAPGDGSWDFAMALGQAWLCEGDDRERPCGRCAACQLYRGAAHPDQNWLVPQELALQRGLPVEVKEGRKPSRQIRIDEVRLAIDALTSTSGRGRGRVLVVLPAEAMNPIAASALLKTLEEPVPGTRIVLAAAEPARLLPTIRSRCQVLRLPTPDPGDAQAWLGAHGVSAPGVLLLAAGGRPLDALQLHRAGVTGEAWLALPGQIASGDGGLLAGMATPTMLGVLARVCHDAMACAVGASPRFFDRQAFAAELDLGRLSRWQRLLAQVLRNPEHPWNEPLLVDALVAQAREAMQPRAA